MKESCVFIIIVNQPTHVSTSVCFYRKELMQCGVLNPEKDLYLGKLSLTKFPKSPETWIHRYVLSSQFVTLCDQLARIIYEEMKVCCDAACRYPSNYNAWSHRIWVLRHMAKGNIKVFHDELSSMRPWVSMHVSDHSGFHYRQFLLKELITELSQSPTNGDLSGAEAVSEKQQLIFSTVLQLFYREAELCSDLIQSFPGHETLWSHRRHVFYLWHQWKQHHCSSTDGDDTGDPAGPTGGSQEQSVNSQRHAGVPMEVDRGFLADPHDNKRLRRGALPSCPLTLETEHVFISSILDSCCNSEQRSFALAYRKWLDLVIGVQS
uniref:Protein prenyltransferase alpha subunit repeat containing 1 n=1 Tax=Kryptolebias marmoratus TaxID=37003 RepID=A0A3Q3BAF4_KRYMA